MDKENLQAFYRWFMESLPYCIEELMRLVTCTPGFSGWEAEDTPGSLDGLGAWFATRVNKREYAPAEIEAIRSGLGQGPRAQFIEWDLTDETKSMALYVGMYYGEVAIRSVPLLRWEQCMGCKTLADYGQPILKGGGLLPVNPVRVAHSVAFGCLEGTKDGGALRKGYNYWAGLRTAP